jgi:copper oxidase (laccase) domain-containing protein
MIVRKIWPNHEIVITTKNDWDAIEKTHPIYTSFVVATQVHWNTIFLVDDSTPVWKNAIYADALFTQTNKPIGVLVADCLPVVLIWTHAYAIVHCSRRTLHAWLLQKTISAFYDASDKVQFAYLWPCNKQYEVGSEFIDYFPIQFLHSIIWTPWKYLFDMVWYVMFVLEQYAICWSMITIEPWCTYTDSHIYRCYRKGDATQRNFVWVSVVK